MCASFLVSLYYHWVPSHLDDRLCSSPFESWVVDSNRGPGANELFAKVLAFDGLWWQRMERTLRFLVDVGEARKLAADSELPVPEDEPVAAPAAGELLCEALQVSDRDFGGYSSSDFLHEVHGWLLLHCTPEGRPRLYSFLEWFFLVGFLFPIRFPCHAGEGLMFAQDLFTRLLSSWLCFGGPSLVCVKCMKLAFSLWTVTGCLVWVFSSLGAASGCDYRIHSEISHLPPSALGRRPDRREGRLTLRVLFAVVTD